MSSQGECFSYRFHEGGIHIHISRGGAPAGELFHKTFLNKGFISVE